ncbi:aldo/keto reductase [Streptomyces noursei]|uniref:aldo/keto reductase n=1 Tax=Streptomyces noursei TaxID=1971 RepID=UPI00167889B8|nr:aldo/keto reductase [Streptomyces noursei]MCZ1015644.1 aldo/keto reductase [Streptomyces noursei]GGW89705.1 oxidoreductase [Streptomyces noursei]
MTTALGLGTYRCREITTAATAALEAGVTWIDTAPNYQGGEAERQLAPFLSAHPEVQVSTKAGYLAKNHCAEAVQAGVLTAQEAKQGHSLNPSYVSWQVERSRTELGRSPDIVFLHNPEHGHSSATSLAQQLLPAFVALEEACDRGAAGGYGIATWSALHGEFTTIGRLLKLAHQAGGPNHHLQAVQLPLSLVQITPLAHSIDGVGVLADAHEAGLHILGAAPLHGGELMEILTPAAVELLVPGLTPLEAALGAVASSPGVTRILLSASTAEHWEEAAAAVSQPLPMPRLRKIVDAFSP